MCDACGSGRSTIGVVVDGIRLEYQFEAKLPESMVITKAQRDLMRDVLGFSGRVVKPLSGKRLADLGTDLPASLTPALLSVVADAALSSMAAARARAGQSPPARSAMASSR